MTRKYKYRILLETKERIYKEKKAKMEQFYAASIDNKIILVKRDKHV